MTKKYIKKSDSVVIDRDGSLLALLNNESDSIKKSLTIIEDISRKYNVGFEQISELLNNRDNYVSLPICLFRNELGPLEAVVRYMKDVLEYSFAHIARLLNRDETTIWTTYKNSLKKSEKLIVDFELRDIDFAGLRIKKEEMIIPLSSISDRGLSILESLCFYLRENFGLSYKNIGEILGRDERTIWTVVSRAKRKLKDE